VQADEISLELLHRVEIITFGKSQTADDAVLDFETFAF